MIYIYIYIYIILIKQSFSRQVRIQMISSNSSRLEALKVAVAVQKDVLGLVEAGCLQRLRETVEETRGTGGTMPTLAELTRYVRLQAVVNVSTQEDVFFSFTELAERGASRAGDWEFGSRSSENNDL